LIRSRKGFGNYRRWSHNASMIGCPTPVLR
jgi:hypothetical protein